MFKHHSTLLATGAIAIAAVAAVATLVLFTVVLPKVAPSAEAAPAQQTATTKPVMVIYKTTDEYHALDTTEGKGIEIPSGNLPRTPNLLGEFAPAMDKNGNLYGIDVTSRRDSNSDGDRYYVYSTLMKTVEPNGITPTDVGRQNTFTGRVYEGTSSLYVMHGAAFLGDTLYAMLGNYLFSFDLETGDQTRLCYARLRATGTIAARYLAVVGNTLYTTENNTDSLHTIAPPSEVGTGASDCIATHIGTPSNNWGGTYSSLASMAADGTKLYGVARQNVSPSDNHLVEINKFNGVATRIGTGTYAEDEALTNNFAFMAHDHYFINTSGMTACAETDAENHGIFDGTSADIQGGFLTASCLADTDRNASTEDHFLGDDDKSPARIFNFQMKSGREVDMTINPTKAIPFTWLGEYRFRLRTGGVDGDILADSEEAGRGSFTAFRVSLGGSTEYTLEVMRAGVGGGPEFSVNLAYPYIPPNTPTPVPTPSPVPTPTPRVQTNQDVRLYPNPQNTSYQQGQSHSFQLEGSEQHFPVRLLLGNVRAFSVSKTQQANCTSPANEVTELTRGDYIYIHVCDVSGSPNSLVRILRTSDDTEMALYSIHARGETAVEVARVPAATGAGTDVSERDVVGLAILVAALCEAIGTSCDAGLVKNTVALVGSALLGILPTLAAGGRVSTPGIALGLVIFTFGIMLGYLLVGLPLWMPALAVVALVIAAGMGLLMRFGRVNF